MGKHKTEVKLDGSKLPSKRSYGLRGMKRVLREGTSTALRKMLSMVLSSKETPEFEQLGDGDRITVFYEEQGLNLACCTCGLVHYIAFDVIDGVIVMRFWRNEEETTKLRARKGIVTYEEEE